MSFTGDHRHNVFVPSYAPQFKAMQNAGGILGVSLEDSKRAGVWVPLEWLDQITTRSTAWKPLTSEQLFALYGRKQPELAP